MSFHRLSGLDEAKLALQRKFSAISYHKWNFILEKCKCELHGSSCLLSFRHERYPLWETCCFDVSRLLTHRDILPFPILQLYSLMTKALSDEDWHKPGFAGTEGFAGSSPLAVLELVASRFPRKGKISGRWSSLIKDNNGDLLHWKPKDGDYFIVSRSKADFEARVRTMITKLRAAAASVGKQIRIKRPRTNNYAFRDGPITIVDVIVQGLQVPISFVESPRGENMRDVVNQFDIDVAQVIYDVACSGKLFVNSNLFERIRAGQADAKDIQVTEGGPSAFETNRIQCTIRRMRKYGPDERGYHFCGYPTFVKYPEDKMDGGLIFDFTQTKTS